MSRKISRSTEDTAWLRDFQELLNRPDEKLPPGDGWATFDEICEGCKKAKGNNKIRRIVTGLVDRGDYEMFKGVKYCPVRNKAFKQVWYRPSSKKRAHRASRLAP